MSKNPVIDSYGTKRWFNEKGQLHTREWADGSKSWYLNGKRHREDGPAIEWANGDKEWYLNDKELSEDLHQQLTEGPLGRLPLYLGQGFDEFIGKRLRDE